MNNIHEAKPLQPITSQQLNAWLLLHVLGLPMHLLRHAKPPYTTPPFILFQTSWSPLVWNKIKWSKCCKLKRLFYFYNFKLDVHAELLKLFRNRSRHDNMTLGDDASARWESIGAAYWKLSDTQLAYATSANDLLQTRYTCDEQTWYVTKYTQYSVISQDIV